MMAREGRGNCIACVFVLVVMMMMWLGIYEKAIANATSISAFEWEDVIRVHRGARSSHSHANSTRNVSFVTEKCKTAADKPLDDLVLKIVWAHTN